jgi:hypothetical protein
VPSHSWDAYRRAAAGVGIAAVLAACGGDLPHLPEEPTPDALSVNLLLQRGGARPQAAGEDLPEGRTYGFVGLVSSPGEVYLQPLWDARVAVNGAPLTVRRTAENEFYTGVDRPLESGYNYYSDSLRLQPATDYTLFVEAGGRRLTGRTRMPGEFSLRAVNGVAGGRRVPRGEPLVLHWGRADGAALYAVTVEDGNENLEIATRLPVFTSDTTAVLPFANSASATVPITVEIRAMDSNLYRASVLRDSRAGLEGGFGFFGSANVKRYRIDLEINR